MTTKRPSERIEEIYLRELTYDEEDASDYEKLVAYRVAVIKYLDEQWEEQQKKLAGTDSEHPYKSEWKSGS